MRNAANKAITPHNTAPHIYIIECGTLSIAGRAPDHGKTVPPQHRACVRRLLDPPKHLSGSGAHGRRPVRHDTLQGMGNSAHYIAPGIDGGIGHHPGLGETCV